MGAAVFARMAGEMTGAKIVGAAVFASMAGKKSCVAVAVRGRNKYFLLKLWLTSPCVAKLSKVKRVITRPMSDNNTSPRHIHYVTTKVTLHKMVVCSQAQ